MLSCSLVQMFGKSLRLVEMTNPRTFFLGRLLNLKFAFTSSGFIYLLQQQRSRVFGCTLSKLCRESQRPLLHPARQKDNRQYQGLTLQTVRKPQEEMQTKDKETKKKIKQTSKKKRKENLTTRYQ